MVRFGEMRDVDSVNVIRKQVCELHRKSEPAIFKKFSKELGEYVKKFIGTENKLLLVAEEGNEICGYAMVEVVRKPETAYLFERHYLDIQELGVLSAYQKKGYGKELINKVVEIAKEENIHQIELNAWCFNENALEFYRKLGFETYRQNFRLRNFG